MNSAQNGNSKSSSKKMIFAGVLVLFLVVILYIIYRAYARSQETNANEPIIISDIIDANIARPSKTLPTPTNGMAQSLSTWVYIKSWNYNFGKYKNILWKTDNPTADAPLHSPSLWLYPLTNNLKVITSVDTTEKVESCDINNIPLMKWVNIVYVLNNRTVDVYINGKLERSCALKGVPASLSTPINLYTTYGNPAGYDGKIGKTQYFTRALMPNEVASIYNSGPIGSSQYNIKFFDNGKIIHVSDASDFS